MQEPSVRQLRYFVLVAECASFRAAAERVFRSQSAITLSIQELEGLLGAPLFQSGRRAQLTDFGRQCLPIAIDMVERFTKQTSRLHSISTSPTVTMAVLPSFASRWLPRFLEVFTDRHPEIALRVLDDNSRNVEEMVISGRVDIGIVSLGKADHRWVTTPLITDEFGLVCNKDHALAKNKWLAWSAVPSNLLLGNLTHGLLASSAAARFVQEPRLYISNMTSLLSLIATGNWISPLPVLAVPMQLPGIVAIPLRRPRVTRQIGMIHLKAKSIEPAVAAVQAIVTEVVQSPP